MAAESALMKMLSHLPLAALLQHGLSARQTGQWAAAHAAYAMVLKRHPEHPQALHLLGDLASAQGDLNAAAGWLRRSLQAQPNQAHAWSSLGAVQEELGHLADAQASFGRAAELKPDRTEALYNRARLLRLLGKPDAAALCLRQALKLGQAPPALQAQMLQLQALLQEEAGDLEPALATLNQALQVAPQRAPLHHNRGVLLQRLARPAAALAAHEHALALGLNAADAHYNRGNSLQSLGRSADALDAYRSALVLEPQHALALYDIARLRWRLGDAAFSAELDAAAAAEPTSAVGLGIKGRLLLRAERHADAAAAFAQAAARADAVAGYFDGLGQALSRLGRFDEALSAHRRAVALAPDQAATHISHASSLLQAGDSALAAQVAETAVRLAPLDQHAWATLGLAWRAMQPDHDTWLNDYQQHVQVYDLPPPEGWADAAGFNQSLACALADLHTDVRAPIDQTLRHGSQTLGNLFEQDHPLLTLLKVRIGAAVDHYIAHLDTLPRDDGHPLLGRTSPRWRFSDSWSSRLRSGGFHTRHVHPHGWISSCYYVALPPVITQPAAGVAAQAGWIEFGAPDIGVPGRDLPARRAVQPLAGRLVLFPSFMWHGTVPFEAAQPRLTVAFDVLPLD